MFRKGMEHNFSYIELLSEKDVLNIHYSTLQVLKNTGIVIKDEEMLQSLLDVGCQVDFSKELAKFPEDVVMEKLGLCPSSFIGSARDPENNLLISSGKTSFFIPGCAMKMFDDGTGEIREPSRKEFYNSLRIVDALENLDFQNSFPFFGFAKVPDCMRLIESVAAKYRVSTKVQIEGSVYDNYIINSQLSKVVGVDLFQLVNSVAPLTYCKEHVEQIRYFAKNNIAFHFAPGPIRGLTGPSTIAGSLVTNNAETIAGIVMAQLINPGTRIWVNSMVFTPNMLNGTPAFGDIGNAMFDAAFNQMWRYYRIPTWTNSSAWTNSKGIDYQAGYEGSLAALLSALSGSTAMAFQGGLYAEISASPLKAIMDDDIAGMIKRVMQGIEVSTETLATGLIHEIGPMPGTYIATDHTFNWWRKECYIPLVADRLSYQKWELDGRKNIIDYAKEKMKGILETHKIKYLPPEKENAIEKILSEAREYYRKRGLISDEEWNVYQEDLSSTEYPYA